MCGIAGFSMHPNSTVNTRALAHNLLTGIESRGSDASGYAFAKGKTTGVYKNHVPGSQLPLGDLPRRASAGILHTRLATQGSRMDNRNNHPVLSPSGNMALVHNGIISNDWEFRPQYGDAEFDNLPAVDSAVIPALIEKYGLVKGAAKLEGYAAIAYIDSNGDNDPEVLNVVRLDYSPVFWTWLTDGSFVFASTKPILALSLFAAGLDHGAVFELPEETGFRVKNGVILEQLDDVEMQEDWYARRKWGAATTGHRTASTGTVGSEVTNTMIGSSFRAQGVEMWDDEKQELVVESDELSPAEEAELERMQGEWDKDYRNTQRIAQKALTTNPEEIAMALAPETNSGRGRNGRSEVWLPDPDTGGLRFSHYADMDESLDFQAYYVMMEDGGMDYFEDIDDLESRLDWLCNMGLYDGAPFPDVEHKLKWTNHVADIGVLNGRNQRESWIEDLGLIDAHESPAVRNLEFIRDGLTAIMIHNMA
jgi:hypothetical protein